MTVRFLDLHAQYQSISDEIDAAIAGVIRDSAFIGGSYLKSFEENFAAYLGALFCIGVGNGTDAIEIAVEALGLPPGSEILVPANSFIASSEAVTRGGSRVVFCDCDPETYTISVADARRRVTPNTKAIVAVHLYGHPCDMDAVMALAAEHDLYVIEDAAQAHGAKYKGRRVGGIGIVGTFSFYPGKNLGAYGDGGAIVTNDPALAKRCRMIANHGRVEKYNHEFEGRNSRLDGLQAAILDVKLRHLDRWLETRCELARCYLDGLSGVPGIVLPVIAPWAFHVWHLFVVRVDDREGLSAYLTRHGVQTGVHYPISLPHLRAYAHLDTPPLPCSGVIADQLLSLPLGDQLTTDEVRSVCRLIKAYRSESEHIESTAQGISI
ncbi:DegT/DnrJ/EryC1/StrS family aminotransferase [Geomonas azotofigens]|uniref:DegT/DnrJ/EryC1/StrS family aminotransferase n=1 Tax=Geomonas azotofigens TaxID=2843196 RepID=UPI001C1229C9|nr:DegT/DnrJ/EryC1/StrS family aminotransferase [Geomonas azotofigens]MBU5613368.1 DegT/DnrJ/EryC1/StrS family aminotransferase [Geomonas azotofigens]